MRNPYLSDSFRSALYFSPWVRTLSEVSENMVTIFLSSAPKLCSGASIVCRRCDRSSKERGVESSVKRTHVDTIRFIISFRRTPGTL
jgi:hypothetical protein